MKIKFKLYANDDDSSVLGILQAQVALPLSRRELRDAIKILNTEESINSRYRSNDNDNLMNTPEYGRGYGAYLSKGGILLRNWKFTRIGHYSGRDVAAVRHLIRASTMRYASIRFLTCDYTSPTEQLAGSFLVFGEHKDSWDYCLKAGHIFTSDHVSDPGNMLIAKYKLKA